MVNENHREQPRHADFAYNSHSSSRKNPQTRNWGVSVKEFGWYLGKIPNEDLTQEALETLTDEIDAADQKIDDGEFFVAVVRLNAFWDGYLHGGVHAEIERAGLDREVNKKYGSRIEQANSYGIIGDEVEMWLSELNRWRHGPGHEPWSELDDDDSELVEVLENAVELTKEHRDHLRKKHL